MKTVFVINPHAGQGDSVDKLIDKINNMSGIDREFYITKEAGDATRYVKNYCEKFSDL